MNTVSKRALKLMSKPSEIIEAAVTCAQNPFSLQNTDGFLNLGVAENHLIDDILFEKTSKPAFSKPEHAKYHHYHEIFGTQQLRQSFCLFLNEFFSAQSYNPENVIISSGASATLEMLSFSLLNPGEKIAIPAPYYTGFEHDLEKRFEGKVLPYLPGDDTQASFESSHFSDADTLINFLKIEKPKAALVCHPNNPTGLKYSSGYIKKLIDFANENKVHIIFDEVYFCTNLTNDKTTSSLEFMGDSQYVHFIYSMAKDFALGGFKVGFFYTNNEELSLAMKMSGYFHTPATHTQILCSSILEDTNWVHNLQNISKKRINEAFDFVKTEVLDIVCDSYTSPQHGFFSFINLKSQMKKLNIQDDFQMHKYLLKELKINILPDNFFGLPQKNFFRLCFAKPKEQLIEFSARMKRI